MTIEDKDEQLKTNIVLYTTGCPRCNVLKAKLKAKNINYQEFTDIDRMQKMGIQQAPMLMVGNTLMDFSTAINWIRKA